MEPNELIAPPLSSNERRFILTLLLIAVAVRLYVFFHTYVIAIDGVFYIQIARQFASGDFATGLSNYYPPFYPLCIAAVSKIIPDFETAGQLVSLFFGMLLFFPVYMLARDNFGPRIAQITVILFAFQDQLVKYSSQVRTESAYYALAALGIYCGWSGIQKRKLLLFALSGFFAVLSYLTRPEGIGIFLLIAAWLVFSGIRNIKKEFLFKLAAFTLLIAPAAALSIPYMLAIAPSAYGGGKGEGELKITRKKSFSAILGLERMFKKYEVATAANEDIEQEDRAALEESEFQPKEAENVLLDFLARLWRLFLNFIEDFHPLLFILALFAVFRRRVMFYIPRFEWFIFCFFIMYICVFALVRTSHRHPTQLIPLTLFWAAIGISELHYILLVKFSRNGSASIERLSARITHIILVIVIIFVAVETLKPRRFERLPVKSAGNWLRENSPLKPRIGTNEYRVAFYADAAEVFNVYGIDQARRKLVVNSAMIKSLVERKKVDYIVLEKTSSTPESFADAAALPCLREIRAFKLPDNLKGQEVYVFEPVEPSGGNPARE